MQAIKLGGGHNWHFDSGEDVQNRFSRWGRGDHLGFFIEMILNILPTSHSDTFYHISSQLTIPSIKEKFKIDFQDGAHGGHLGFSIRMILAILYHINWP